MRLRDILEINQQGMVADAVTLSLMNDPDKNLELCEGFVFNYNAAQPKFSTLGVLDLLRESFHSSNNPNIHLMVQDFGKGKSHFALTVANFFKQSADRPEVEGILGQIRFVTSGNTQVIYERLKAYKERSRPHLVVCISGERGIDLGKTLVQALQTALKDHGIGDTLAHHFTEKPLNYLRQLASSDGDRAKAEAFLKNFDSFSGDLARLIDDLQEGQYDRITTAKQLSAELNNGIPFDFEVNLNIEAMFEEVIQNFCVGENRRFEGILLLFDELNAYLRTWLANPIAAGGYVLQNITNLCSHNPGKIALLCLAQVKPSLDTQISLLDRKNYERFTTRIELAPSTYEPESSLELVIDKLLKQSDDEQWEAFLNRFGDTLREDSRTVYEHYISAYKRQSWTFQKFYNHLGQGCYPLHPMTASLLCQLEFTQGRTVIQFIKEDVASFIKDTTVEDKIKYVYPVRLMDAFQSNFAQQSIYEDFKKTYDSIAANASPEEITVLKAIGLYYLSGDKITKSTKQKHEELLSLMTGYSIPKLRGILAKLSDEYQAIYYNSGNNTYRFYSGYSINDLRRKLDEDIENLPVNFNSLVNHCRKNLSHYLGSDTIRAENFVDNHRLNGEDWQFERQLFTVDQFERVLSTERTVKSLTERGLIAYFMGQYDQDLQAIEKEAEAVLARAPKAVQERIIIAIPSRGTRDLDRVLLLKDTLSKKSTQEKQEFGAALTELTKQFDSQLDAELQEVFDGCIYTCRVIDKVPLTQRKSLEPIVSKMLEELYIYTPSVENQDKLKAKSTSGSGIVSYAAKQLLDNTLKEPFPNAAFNTVITTVFTDKWGILKKGRPYTVLIPKDANVRQAWDTISELTKIENQEQSITEIRKIWTVLSDAPFGYNELTFTMLFAAWLSYHRGEIELSGGFGIPKKKADQVGTKSAPIHEWAQTNILDKPKDFVQTWILQMGNKVIRRKPLEINIPEAVTYDQALSLVEQIKTARQTGLLDQTKIWSLEKKEKQLQQGIDAINNWHGPTQRAQTLLNNKSTLEALVGLYEPLEENLPIVIKDGVTTVRPTEDQTNSWRQTRQALREKIEALVEADAARGQAFESTDEGYSLRAEIQQRQKALEAIPKLPSRFLDSLKATHEAIDQRIQHLQELENSQQVLEQIQTLYKTLGNNHAPQSQYSSILASIKELVDGCPALKQDTRYLTILQDIETQQDELTRKLDRWESRFSTLASTDEAYRLSQEVNREVNRFDQEDSRQQINSLTSRIETRILQKRDEKEEEESLSRTLEQARQKAQAVTSLTNLADAIQAYDDLSQLGLPPTQKVSDVDTYRQELEVLKAEGKQAIERKFDQLFQTCSRELQRPEDYQQLKRYITRSRELINKYADFSALQENLQTAEDSLEAQEDSLEAQYEQLRKRAEDARLMRELENLKLPEGNTIKRCEDIIAKIQDLRAKLNFPDHHQDRIDRLVRAFQGKRAEYSLELDELTSTLQTTATMRDLEQLRNTLSKLEFVFRDSSEYARYQSVENQLKTLRENLENITGLESQAQNAQTIADLQQVLMDVSRHLDQSPDRFQARLQKLTADLQERQQRYVDQLNQWQQDLGELLESAHARRLQAQVADKRIRYQGSDYESSYEAINTDLQGLTQLLALIDVQKTDTIAECQNEIERIDEWQATQVSLSATLEQRIQSARSRLMQIQQTLFDRERHTAHQQLSTLRSRVSQLNASDDPTQKLSTAQALLKEIRRVRNQYEPFLEDEQKDILRDCEQRCEEVQSQDYASEIETLFQKLPKEKRVELYRRLSAYLEATTEVF